MSIFLLLKLVSKSKFFFFFFLIFLVSTNPKNVFPLGCYIQRDLYNRV